MARKPRSKVKSKDLPSFPSVRFMDWLVLVKKLMFLTDYDVYVSSEPCSSESDAEMEFDEYRRIKLSFPPTFTSFTPERKRAAVCHEYCHVPIKIAKRPYEAFENTVSSDAWSVVATLGADAEEDAVTLLEWTIAPHLPLPPDEKYEG